jgi:hypothetical protein
MFVQNYLARSHGVELSDRKGIEDNLKLPEVSSL